jgi:hypothetical protein
MSSLSTVNQYHKRITHRVGHWKRTNVVMGSNLCQVSFLVSFRAVTMLLFYMMQRITTPKLCIFLKSVTKRHCMTLLQVALVSIPSHKFVLSPCWYYLLQEIKKYDFRVHCSGITSIPNYIQIRPAVIELNHSDRRTDRQTWSALYASI